MSHSVSNSRDAEQFYLSTLGRIEGKLDDLIKTAASSARVDDVESRVRELETSSASRRVLDRVAWSIICLLTVGNSAANILNYLNLN